MPRTESESLHHAHPAWMPADLTRVEGEEPIAPHYFNADTLSEAADSARTFLRSAAVCHRCCRGLAQMHARLGSTFFRDDDPLELICAFEPEDRNSCVLRILAAFIVVYGGEPARAMH